MKNDEYVLLPNSMLLYDEMTIEVYYWLIYNENKFKTTRFSINWLIEQCNIVNDKNGRNKRYLRKLFELSSNDDVIEINIDSLYEHNENNKRCNFTIIQTNEHDIINDISLFKQFFYIARNIDNGTMYMGNSIQQMSDALGYSKNTVSSNNEKLKELGIIDYINTKYYSDNNGHYLNYTNFYTLTNRVDDTQEVLNKAIEYYNNTLENIGLRKVKENSYSDIRKANGVISYYSRLDIDKLTIAQKEKYNDALEFMLNTQITDWGDKPTELFIQSLVDNRYKKFGFTYDVCEKIFNGELKIVDAIEEYAIKEKD